MPAPWSTVAPLNALVTLLGTLTGSGLQKVYTGVPESFSNQVCAYVTAGAQRIDNKATGGLMQRLQAYRVVLTYAVDGAEATAETTLCAVVDAFTDALFADRTLGGTLESMEFDAEEAGEPLYVRVSGEEIRMFPFTIRGAQRKTYPV